MTGFHYYGLMELRNVARHDGSDPATLLILEALNDLIDFALKCLVFFPIIFSLGSYQKVKGTEPRATAIFYYGFYPIPHIVLPYSVEQ